MCINILRGILNLWIALPTEKKHEIKCPMNKNDFTVVVFFRFFTLLLNMIDKIMNNIINLLFLLLYIASFVKNSKF